MVPATGNAAKTQPQEAHCATRHPDGCAAKTQRGREEWGGGRAPASCWGEGTRGCRARSSGEASGEHCGTLPRGTPASSIAPWGHLGEPPLQAIKPPSCVAPPEPVALRGLVKPLSALNSKNKAEISTCEGALALHRSQWEPHLRLLTHIAALTLLQAPSPGHSTALTVPRQWR